MRIAVAISGGIDSLRTAVLLRESGHEVYGIHMRQIPSGKDGRDSPGGPPEWSENALERLTAEVGIPLIVVDLREAFEAGVIRPFLETYLRGLTPNPCIVCNPTVKFGLLREKALDLGAAAFATGHYARILPPDGTSERYRLRMATDRAKDQSYFLFGLSQEQLATTLFPLGDSSKQATRQWAAKRGLDRLISEESQEICFIPATTSYHEFMREFMGDGLSYPPGPIIDMAGAVVGEHKGIHTYTIGQRRGLGIASTAPYYVVELDPRSNTVRVGRAQDLFRTELTVENINWVSIPPPSDPFSCRVRIRRQHIPAPALVAPVGETSATVQFLEPQRALTPGQAAVFYDDDMLLGGGIIQR